MYIVLYIMQENHFKIFPFYFQQFVNCNNGVRVWTELVKQILKNEFDFHNN